MATKLPTVLLADLSIALASEILIGGTTGTLSSNLDKDNVTIPNGLIYLTLDSSNSSKEHIQAIKTGTALASIFSVSRQGVLTSGVVRKHRIGAIVSLTDFATIKYLNDLLKGITNLDSSTPLAYDGTASITTANQLATKAYIDVVAIAGAPNASTTVKGIVEIATQTEVDAKTTAGGTGALLVVAPDTQRSTLLSDGVFASGVVATLTIATPCVITYTAHGLIANDTIQLTTTGALPTGLTVSTTYYVIATGLTANTFQISATNGGTAINTTGSQSGVHSLFRSNQYVFNTTPATTSLATFKEFSFKAVNANTTTSPTVVINGLAPVNIRKQGGTALLSAGDIAADMIVKLQYDGTNFQVLSPSALALNNNGDGSNLTGITPVNSVSTDIQDNYYSYQLPMINNSNTSFYGWSNSVAVSVSSWGGGCSWFPVGGGPAFTGQYLQGANGSTTANYQFNSTKTIRVKWKARANSTNGRHGWGLDTGGSVYNLETDASGYSVRFLANGASLYAVTSNGAGPSNTNTLISGITITNTNTYEIVLTTGTPSAQFYVNGVLKATHTTSMPVIAIPPYFCFGVTNINEQIDMTWPTVTIQS